MGYRTIEQMKTKNNIYIDRVNRFEGLNGINGAKARLWFFLYNCTADDNLAWATCSIEDDNGATYQNDRYDADVVEPAEEPAEE